MTAYFLKRAGVKVCLLERDRLATGDTGSTTAHLTAVTDTRLRDLVRGFGERNARLVWDAGEVAINAIENVVRENEIECEFRRVPGFLHSSLDDPSGDGEVDTLKKESDLVRHLGIEARFDSRVPIVFRPGINFSNQAKCHPLLLLAGLAKLIPGEGSAIFEESEVTRVEAKPLVVHCGVASVETRRLIIATNVPIIGNRDVPSAALFQTKISSYSSYVVGAEVPKGKYPQLSLWDTSDPYYYLRTDPGVNTDYVIFGGNDHKTGQVSDTKRRYEDLQKVLTGIMPDANVCYRWSGQVVETHDGLPFIGETSEDQFISTGYCGNGFTFGTLSALMARDWVLNQSNPWIELFHPNRKEIHGGGVWNYLTENIDYPTYLFKDRLLRREPFSPERLGIGEGKIMELKGEKIACCRDSDGKLHTVSAICTHLSCIVSWNAAELTWDCPCHGSRFRPDGTVIAGPAEIPLKAVKPDKPKVVVAV